MEFFHTLITNSQDAILVLTQDMELLYESPSASHLLDFEGGSLVGKNPIRIVHPDDLSRVSNVLQYLAQNPGKTIRLIGRTRVGKDGKSHILEATAYSMVHIPEVSGIVLSIRDITEREKELKDAFGIDRAALKQKDYQLTSGECRVLVLLGEGLSNFDIAGRLGLSHATVKFHVSNILRKLGVTNRAEAVALIMREHLIEN